MNYMQDYVQEHEHLCLGSVVWSMFQYSVEMGHSWHQDELSTGSHCSPSLNTSVPTRNSIVVHCYLLVTQLDILMNVFVVFVCVIMSVSNSNCLFSLVSLYYRFKADHSNYVYKWPPTPICTEDRSTTPHCISDINDVIFSVKFNLFHILGNQSCLLKQPVQKHNLTDSVYCYKHRI